MMSRKLASPHFVFALVAVCGGLFFVLATPPFQAPDEFVHFFRSFQVSEGGLIATKFDDRLGGWLPRSLATIAEPYYDVLFDSSVKTDPADVFRSLEVKLNPDDRVFTDFAISALYSPVPYLPQSLGIGMGRLLGAPPTLLMYLGRLTNLLVWVTLVAIALRTTPILKWAFLLLALTPMGLFQASSLSVDGPTNALGFLVTALLLHVAFGDGEREVDTQVLTALFVGSVALTLSKTAYCPILALYLLVPVRRIGSTRRYLLVSGALVLANLVALVGWSLVVHHLYIPAAEYNPAHLWGQPLIDGTDPLRQLLHASTHPIEFLGVAIRSYWASLLLTVGSFVGVLGWMDTPMPLWLVGSSTAALVLVPLVDTSERVAFGWATHAVVSCTAACCVLVFTLFAYMSWVPVGGDRIVALQGRYFIPIGPAIALTLYNRKLRVDPRWLRIAVPIYAVFALVVADVVVLRRYYVL